MLRADKPSTVKAVQRELERRIRGPLDALAWAELTRGEWVDDVIKPSNPMTMDDLLDEYRALVSEPNHSTLGRSTSEPAKRAQVYDRHSDVLADIIAMDSSHSGPVQQFRQRYFGCGLLQPGEVNDWIHKQAANERGKVRSLLAHARTDGEATRPLPLRRGLSRELVLLPYGKEDIVPFDSVLISPDGLLGELKVVAQDFARGSHCDEAEAVIFILTGRRPALPAIVGEWWTHEKFPALDRIWLRIDPRQTDKDVAAFYRAFRKQPRVINAPADVKIFSGRIRRMSEKHVELARYGAELIYSDGTTSWRDLRRRWNANFSDRHPSNTSWAYSDLTQFRRDARTAYNRLLGRSLK